MVSMGELWATLGPVMFALAIFKQFFPYQLWRYVENYGYELVRFFHPYIEIRFDEFSSNRMKRSEAFSAIPNYLSTKTSLHAIRFKADVGKDGQSLVLSMGDKEEVIDEFDGVKVWWVLVDEMRFYKLTFHRSHREIITGSYVKHVLDGGKAIAVKDRQRKLFSIDPSKRWYGWKQRKWSHVHFEHPATFDTLATETKNREDIKKDLMKFTEEKSTTRRLGRLGREGISFMALQELVN